MHNHQMIFCGHPQNFIDNGRRKSDLSFTPFRTVYLWQHTFIWNSDLLSGFKRRPSTPNFNSIGRKIEVRTQFHLHPYVTHVLFCTNVNETHNCSTTIHKDLLYRISSETAKQNINWVKNSFMQAGKTRLILRRFSRSSQLHSNFFCQKLLYWINENQANRSYSCQYEVMVGRSLQKGVLFCYFLKKVKKNCGVATRGAYFEEKGHFAIPWSSVLTASASGSILLSQSLVARVLPSNVSAEILALMKNII